MKHPVLGVGGGVLEGDGSVCLCVCLGVYKELSRIRRRPVSQWYPGADAWTSAQLAPLCPVG